MFNYFHRVSDYINDPFFPINKLNPLHWIEALWNCLFNSHLYTE